jgi:hypothetical protein
VQIETFSNMRPPLTHLEAAMLFSRFAQSAAALALLTIGLAAPVHAQFNKQIISGTWYEDRAVAANSGNGTLILTFAQTPTNQFLNVTNVSCSVNVLSVQVIAEMTLNAGTTSGTEDIGRPYEIKGNVTPETIASNKFYSIVTNQVFYKFGPGRFPSIEIDTISSTGPTSIEARCTIVGNLTDN